MLSCVQLIGRARSVYSCAFLDGTQRAAGCHQGNLTPSTGSVYSQRWRREEKKIRFLFSPHLILWNHSGISIYSKCSLVSFLSLGKTLFKSKQVGFCNLLVVSDWSWPAGKVIAFSPRSNSRRLFCNDALTDPGCCCSRTLQARNILLYTSHLTELCLEQIVRKQRVRSCRFISDIFSIHAYISLHPCNYNLTWEGGE